MSHRFSPRTPSTPMVVYVRDKTVWQYKLLTRNLSQKEALNEQRGHQRGG